MIYLSSLIVPLLAILPNFFFAAAGGARSARPDATAGPRDDGRPTRSPSGAAASLLGAGGASGREPLPLVLLERVGQVGVFLTPVFYPVRFESTLDIVAAVGMAVTLGLYYACWTRYFSRGRERALLVKSLLGIPIPMAVSPVLYFLFASQLLRSPLVFLAALLFAGGHIPITLMQRREQHARQKRPT